MFPKIGGYPPKSSILVGFSVIVINYPFWGTPIFWKHQFRSNLGHPDILQLQICMRQAHIAMKKIKGFQALPGNALNVLKIEKTVAFGCCSFFSKIPTSHFLRIIHVSFPLGGFLLVVGIHFFTHVGG